MNWQRHPDINTKVLPDGYVVLSSSKTDWVNVLNPTGALVWELSDGELNIEEIVDQIQELLQRSDRTELLNQVDTLIKELAKVGLVSEVSATLC